MLDRTNRELLRRRTTIWLSRRIDAMPVDSLRKNWYILGDVPPNYPVPAVQYTVRYHDYHACSPGGFIELRDIGRNFMRKRWFPRRERC